jgi:hypothetical protein
VALKCYFDGSQKHGRRLTLAAIAGDETAWAGLEKDWTAFLSYVGIRYTHMKEAIARKGEFQGWKKEKRDWFVDGLVTFFKEHQAQNVGRLKAFTATVDLKAHRDCSHIAGLPSPARMCVRGIVPQVLDWYSAFPDTILDVMEFYFDRDEPYMQHIDADWKSAAFRSRYPAWGLIRNIAPVEMQITPGVQVADLFAWARTHVDRDRPLDRFYGPALLLCHPSSADHYLIDRKKIETYPPYAIM